MHIVDMIYFWARTMPQRPAVIQHDVTLSYGALAEGIESAAAYFAANIPDKSKPVMVSLSSAPKMLIASFGLLRAGCPIIIGNPQEFAGIPPSESDTRVYERGETAMGDRTNIAFDESWLKAGGGDTRAKRPLGRSRTRYCDVFFFSSGTTGRPKRIVRTQRGWDARMLFDSSSAFADFDRVLLIGLNNSMGFSRGYSVLYAGRTVALLRRECQHCGWPIPTTLI
jgi:acyl-CoA synthetase (AMP-forming)/AMP-acid ligase II